MNNFTKTFRYVNENGDSITFTSDFGYLISKPVGIDAVQISLKEAQGINQVGSTIQSKNVQPRIINVTGVIVGDEQLDRKQKLISVIRPDIQGKFYADDYYLDVFPTATPSVGADRNLSRFAFSLTAPYPYWQRDEHSSIVLAGMEKMFRLWDGDESHRAPNGSLGCWVISQPYSFGSVQATQFINVINGGQLPIPFVARITATGYVTKPKITNANNNKFILINHTLESGEVVEIRLTHSKSYVTSSVHGDIRGALSLASNLFELEVGDNVLKPEAESGAEAMTIDLEYATEVVGITL